MLLRGKDNDLKLTYVETKTLSFVLILSAM